MENSISLTAECQKIIQRLFVFVDTKDIEENTRLGLVVNPQILKIIFKQSQNQNTEYKLILIQEISRLFNKNQFNSIILAKRDIEILEFNHSILEEVISFMLSLKVDIDKTSTVSALFQPFVRFYPIKCRTIKDIISIVAKDFYFQKFNHSLLAMSLKMLCICMKSQISKQTEPSNYFAMYGEDAGLRLISNNVKWPFSKGFHFYINFYIQEFTITDDPMRLMTIVVGDDDFVVMIDRQANLKIKVFGEQTPLIIRNLSKKRWYYISVSYILKNKLLRNFYQLHCIVDNNIHERRDLPIPNISMIQTISELSFGRDFFGRINCVCLSRTEIAQWGKYVMDSWAQVESLLIINKKCIRDFFLIYHPAIITNYNEKQIIYEISSQNHGQMIQNTSSHINPFKEVDINYYGGLYTFLPYFHILKFFKYQKYPSGLQDILNLLLVFFEGKFLNVEIEAINCQFFSVASQLINEIDARFMTLEFVNMIKRLKHTIKHPGLKKQFFINFLWKLSFKNVQEVDILNSFYQIIEQYYQEDFAWACKLYSVDDIFHYIVDNFEPKQKEQCCCLHWLYLGGKDYSKMIEIQNNYQQKIGPLKNILKIVMVNIIQNRSLLSSNSKIMNILFYEYSPCLKLLLLSSLAEGVKFKANFFIEELSLLSYLYQYINTVEFSQEIVCIINILKCCLDQNIQNHKLQSNSIHRIGNIFDKIYIKKYSEIKIRSQSDKLQTIKFLREVKSNKRKYSEEILKSNKSEGNSKKNFSMKSLKKQEISIEYSKSLYESILRFCFVMHQEEEQYLLKHDDYISIVQPYFKVCCQEYKKNIINMVRNTVLIASNDKNIIQNLTKFDKLYKFILSEFILKDLDPDFPDYHPTEQTNYIIRNVYFIIDYMIIGIKNDWSNLYIYILRIVGLLEEGKKQIRKKTQRNVEEIEFAAKFVFRKCILRIVKYVEQNSQNLPNLAFLILLMIFSNVNKYDEGTIFHYFKPIQKLLFCDKYDIVNQEVFHKKDQVLFIDSKLILETVKAFKISTISLDRPRAKVQNFIDGFLDPQYTNQHSEIYRNRKIYLIKANFKILSGENIGIRDFFSGFLASDANAEDISVGQTLSLLLCLCVESGLSSQNLELLKISTQYLEEFFKSYLLLCSRDGLKKEDHKYRNKELPKNICFNIIHFLFSMKQMQYESNYHEIIVETLYRIIYFLGLMIICLNKKLGNPDDLEKALETIDYLKNVEQYNFFSYFILNKVLTLKQIKQFPNKEKQISMNLLNSSKLTAYLKNLPPLVFGKKIEQVVNIHKSNLSLIKKDIEVLFVKENQNISKNITNIQILVNRQDFQKIFVFEHLKNQNMFYRNTKRIWRKIWKRLKLYHYYWSISFNQRETQSLQFQKNASLPYKHKFSKFVDKNGARSILQVEPIEPWHVKKMTMDKQFEYRSSNYLFHLHHEMDLKKESKSFFDKLLPLKSDSNTTSFYVNWIKNNSKRKGYLSIENQKLKFKYASTFQKDSHLEFTTFILAQYKPIEKFWPLIEIINIIERRYLSKKQCLLIEFEDNTSLIFNFINEDKEDFLKIIQNKQNQKNQKQMLIKLNQIQFYNNRLRQNVNDIILQITNKWKNHKISNFQYLMLINKYAGRSYLDPANYPVMPWIIASYDFKQYQYRDLSKTIGGLGSQQRRQFYINKMQNVDPFNPVPPYQFGTHYSSPGMVFNFLIRLQPYTDAGRALQGGRFDLSDRLFSSIKICWHSVTNEVSDVRQLIPQFFYLPDFLLNVQHHNFGITQQKQRVHNVQVPIWAQNAYDYIAIHRRQLQSDKVSQSLNKWIDLIFGYKQKNKIAQQNLNLFYYLTYQDNINLNSIQDQQTKISTQAQIMHFGQTPSQIFYKPHPTRNKIVKRQRFSYKKIKMLMCLETNSTISILSKRDKKLVIFKQFTLLLYQEQNTFILQKQIHLLRNNSKQNIYYIEDLQFQNKVCVFKNNKFIAIASYINGDLIIYNLEDGKKIEEKKGYQKNCIFINSKQNLLLCGCKNGLLQIYQIVYGQKDTITLLKISAEYYMAPITNITEGGNFFAITSGNLIIINKITRGLSYIYDKIKMKGVKMIRSIESHRKILGSLLCCNPLFCVVFYNPLQLCCYSINGQLLKVRAVQAKLPPQSIKDEYFNEYIVVLEDKKLNIYSTPFLQQVRTISLPNKTFKQMNFFEDKCYLITNHGEIITLSEEQVEQE